MSKPRNLKEISKKTTSKEIADLTAIRGETEKIMIYTKLANIQNSFFVPKGQKNTFGNYSYRSCEDILKTVKPLCGENGCVLTINNDLECIGNRNYVKATAILIDLETGEKIESVAHAREEETKKGMDGSQITGAASSYARKYALAGLFCIDNEKDSDATNDHGKGKNDEKPSTVYHDKVINYVHENGLDINAFAAKHKLTQKTTEEEFKALWEKLEKGEE